MITFNSWLISTSFGLVNPFVVYRSPQERLLIEVLYKPVTGEFQDVRMDMVGYREVTPEQLKTESNGS